MQLSRSAFVEDEMKVRFLSAILVLLCFALNVLSQSSESVRLDPTKSKIYLSFERVDENLFAWFRLRNNSSWVIAVRTKDYYKDSDVIPIELNNGLHRMGLVDGLRIEPEYFVESLLEERTIYGTYWCGASLSLIPSGHSVIFKFPIIQGWEKVYIKFEYEWEIERLNNATEAALRNSEDFVPQHQVGFTGFNLQDIIKARATQKSQ